jgi:sodium/potassium-transporting ATPase subunit alpha
MDIKRTNSSFIIGLETFKQKIERDETAGKVKIDLKGSDKAAKGKKKSDVLSDTEAFRTMREHIVPIEELCSTLEVDIHKGLSEQQATAKIRTFGPNRLTEVKALPWYCMFLKTMFGLFSCLLWVSAGLCILAYGFTLSDPTNLILALVLVGVVVLTACFTFYQESKSSAIMAGFKNMIPPVTTVIRDGQEKEMESSYLVPGDIVMLKAGAKIPADLRIIEANNLKVDNSSLTGETEPQDRKVQCTNEKSPLETKNLAFFGTTAYQGTGKGIIINTGDRTVIGNIAKLANVTEEVETTLGIEIGRFVKLISFIAVSFGIIFFVAGIAIGYDIITSVVNAVGIIVANVPEGLLITVTISLTITAKNMAAKQVLVKNLQCVETLGSTTCICSDKTGTLTENKMTIVALWYDMKQREVVNYERRETVEHLGYSANDKTFKMLQYCATLNNKCNWNFEPDKKLLTSTDGTNLSDEEVRSIKEKYKADIKSKSIKTWPVMGGDASETAMIRFFNPILDIDTIRGSYPILVRNTVKGEIPFNSAYKYAVTLHEPVDFAPAENRDDCVLFMKGAPEQIWARCDYLLINGVRTKIKSEHKQEFTTANKNYGGMGRRVLGFAMHWLPSDVYGPEYVFDATLKEGPNFPLQGLTFIGLTALEDPPKLRVKEAVLTCAQAGIKVVMVTGDQPLTAAAIARQVNIITVPKTVNELAEERGVPFYKILDESDAVVVHGEELSKFVEEDKDLDFEYQRLSLFLMKKEVVFARTSPAQKYMIVDCAQKLKHIVAVTGDGVNDSPAIKKADIGIAMAIVGSDVAKDAADMLLMDDNFASIIDGVEEGRKIFDNLGKSIAYALTPNIPELTPFLGLVIFQIPLPLSAILCIVICLGTDMWPSISLAYEYPELDILFRKPRNAEIDHLVTFNLISFSYIQMGCFQSMAGYFVYFTIMNDYGFSPQNLWFFALSKSGTKPNLNDTYDPNRKNRGNTGDKTEAQVDWTTTGDAKYDLRVWFYNMNFGDCKYDDMSSIDSSYHVCYGTEALKYAQCGYFLSIIVLQWANVIIVKTKRVSIFHHGLRNVVSMYGVLFETLLGIFVAFTPGVDLALGGRRVHFLHFFIPGFPFFMLVIVYDELRKWVIRYQTDKNKRLGIEKKGWMEEKTLY